MGGQGAALTWQQIAQKVTEANPGAPPEVIMAAVTKAVPLMQADSAQQWHMVQAQLSQQRIDLAGQREGEAERANRARESGRSDALDERKREDDRKAAYRQDLFDWRKDTKAQDMQMKVQAAQQKAAGLEASQNLKLRQQAVREWQAQYNAYDKYMRNKVNIDSQLGGAEKKEALKELDAQWAQTRQQMDELLKEGPQISTSDAAPSEDALRKKGVDKLKAGEGTPTGPRPTAPSAGSRPLTPEGAATVKQHLQEHPDDRERALKMLQEKGYSTEGL
jgi:hypothetical protein